VYSLVGYDVAAGKAVLDACGLPFAGVVFVVYVTVCRKSKSLTSFVPDVSNV